ncbi:MAG: penicillin-binding protein 2 [Actinomycetota bacterium]|nr:penicillin-binding protein 2 [Actinomycetota bacterium]
MSRPKRVSPSSRRLGRFGILVAVAAALLVGRLVLVQVLNGTTYARFGAGEVNQQVPLPATRGALYDRNGNLLAASVAASNVVVDDFQVTNPVAEANALAPVLHVAATRLATELSQRNGYVVLGQDEPSSVVARLSAMAPAGVTFQSTSLRVAPDAALFQPLLGALNAAGRGVAGLEEMVNAQLSGRSGSEVVPEGPGGTPLPLAPSHVVAPHNGSSIVLTLDQPLQAEVTRDLSAEMASQHAHSGVAVVEDVRTGAILAMVDLVSTPHGIVPASDNLAVTSVYEPGSVMKIATFSYALKDGVVTPQTVLSVPYSLTIGGYPFYDAEVHPTQPMAACEILAQSSNIGTIEIAHQLGMSRLHAALHDLGFGRYTGLGWPGESPGLVGSASSWTGSSQGSVPIGLGEAVTPLQIVDAYAAIANGGVAETPHLVAGTVSPTGVERPVRAPAGRRVLPSWVAHEMVPMFESVIQDGTAVLAQVPGYAVAGKTGTSQQPSSTGGYIPGDWNASFVGFVPAQAPRLAAIVTLNHPTTIYGGSVAAPVFSKIMQYALPHFGIAPPTTPAQPACTGVGAAAPTPA